MCVSVCACMVAQVYNITIANKNLFMLGPKRAVSLWYQIETRKFHMIENPEYLFMCWSVDAIISNFVNLLMGQKQKNALSQNNIA